MKPPEPQHSNTIAHQHSSIEDSGTVIALNGNLATVELIRGGGCKSCSMQGLCFKKNTPAEFKIATDLPLEVGEQVQLLISPVGRTFASLLVFGLPLLGLFSGFLISQVWLSELASIGVGFATMGLAFLVVRFIDRKYSHKLEIHIAKIDDGSRLNDSANSESDLSGG